MKRISNQQSLILSSDLINQEHLRMGNGSDYCITHNVNILLPCACCITLVFHASQSTSISDRPSFEKVSSKLASDVRVICTA